MPFLHTDQPSSQPDTAEILAAVKRIQLLTRQAVTDMISGGYQSVFRGSGMEFEEVREYVPGDDVRAIDWNVTARTGRPYIKKFIEEREQTVMVALDLSASTRLGSTGRNVRSSAAELAAILAFSAAQSGDRVGLHAFTDRVELELPPQTGIRQAFRITREALVGKTIGRGTDLSLACDTLARVLKRKSYVFLISDFLGDDFDRSLGLLAGRHDVVALRLVDPRHRGVPSVGLIRWDDAEEGGQVLVDSSAPAVREMMERRYEERSQFLRGMLMRHGVDLVDIPLGGSIVDPLVAYLHLRERRMR